jgi:tRNA threonylcarbamoyladenosine biosynthesis protein TsaE
MDESVQDRAVNRMSTASVHLSNAGATEAAGARLARALEGGMIVTLTGDLGAGKTTLVRGCLRALGWTGPVKSPSYPLVEHYSLSSLYFYHFDFYRFADPSEWDTAGLAECFRDDSICMIEWPERVGSALPSPDLSLTLAHHVDPAMPGRELTLRAQSKAGERCLNAIIAAPARTT